MQATHIQIPIEKFREIFNQLFSQQTVHLLQDLVDGSEEVVIRDGQIVNSEIFSEANLYQ